jgi:pyrroline-5-carboxylate reductase
MSGYKNFAVVGAGVIGSFIIRQLLTDKATGTVDNVVVLTRRASLASESAYQTLLLISRRRVLKPLSTPLPS